jgi:hypothetical protein
MTGFPDDRPGGPADPGDGPGSGTGSSPGSGTGAPGGENGTDPLEPLLRPPTAFLHAPPGAFALIRRRAARRRRLRVAVGGTAAVAVIAGTFYLAGSLTAGDDEVVGPPASSSRTSSAPAVRGTTAAPSSPPAAGTTPGPSESRQTTVSPAPSTTAGRSASAAPTPSVGATTTSSTPMCTAAQLTASLGGGDAGAGNLYRYLVLTNSSGTACHLTGFPGVSLLDANGKQTGRPATRTQDGYTPVVLAPGGSASDTIHTLNQQGTCLAASAQLRIYPPGSKASLVIPGQITDCGNVFTITPLTSGKTGNPPS